MIIPVRLGNNGYDIVLERGSLLKADSYLNLKRKVFIVTDKGVPKEYSENIATLSEKSLIVTVEGGEESKSFDVFRELLEKMLEFGMTRTDCIVAVGGGVVGDLTGFAAASYMRGIDFYNVPTTVLSQVDSSIGGKVAINMNSIKNIVGAFYQPKCVLIDPEVLSTLPTRQISNGLAESVKMSLTFDSALFELFENDDPIKNIDKIIEKSLLIKRHVVEEDEKEEGLRKVLNFGHTIGHGIESTNFDLLYHGECVALGMIPMCSDEVRTRLIKVLKKLNLPTEIDLDMEKVFEAVSHDKKMSGSVLNAVYVEKAGEFKFIKTTAEELKTKAEEAFMI